MLGAVDSLAELVASWLTAGSARLMLARLEL